LKKGETLKMADGRTIIDTNVLREANPRASGQAFIADWDGDGLLDIIYSCAGWHRTSGSLFLIRNVGTKTAPKFGLPERMLCFGEPIFVTRHGPHPWVGDMDGDGKPDILCYTEWSNYVFFSHAALTMKRRPRFILGEVEKR